ncbi:MAG: hypothetical protein WCS31_07200 [Verrucomicrobiae bacterium]
MQLLESGTTSLMAIDRVPDGLREEISHISDSARLHFLLSAAIRCADLESFVKDL